MKRRRLLQGLLLGFWSKPSAVFTAGSPVSPRERQTLLAFGEVIVRGRVLSATERREFLTHIEDGITSVPEQAAYYRTATTLLDRLAGRSFSTLDIGDRTALLRRHRLDSRFAPRRDDPAARTAEVFSSEAQTIRTRVIPALIDAYWRSPAGWAAVGYEQFPGRCGDLHRYTRAEV